MLFYCNICFIAGLVSCAIKYNKCCNNLAGSCKHAHILFYCTWNYICNKTNQNIYFFAAFILFLHMKPYLYICCKINISFTTKIKLLLIFCEYYFPLMKRRIRQCCGYHHCSVSVKVSNTVAVSFSVLEWIQPHVALILWYPLTVIHFTLFFVEFVEYEPRWTGNMPEFQVKRTPALHTVDLKCPAHGNPKPTIRWLKNNQPFTERPGEVRIALYSQFCAWHYIDVYP